VKTFLRISTGTFTCFNGIQFDANRWKTHYPELLKEYPFRNTLQLRKDGNRVEGILSVVHGPVVRTLLINVSMDMFLRKDYGSIHQYYSIMGSCSWFSKQRSEIKLGYKHSLQVCFSIDLNLL
jgi:hypothetical protein